MIASLLSAVAALMFDQLAPQGPSMPISDGNAQVVVPARLLNLDETVTPNDYPLEALRRNETGVASFLLAIDEEGRVADCRIENSSGSTDLDAQTCHLYLSRARFDPARDKDGRRIASRLHQRIRWQIPDAGTMMLADMHTRLTVDVAADGSIKRCRTGIMSPLKTSGRDCSHDPYLQRQLLAWLKEAPLLRGRTMVLDTFLIIDGGRPPNVIDPKAVWNGTYSIEFSIGPNSKPFDCRVIEETDKIFADQSCEAIESLVFVKLASDENRSAGSKVRMTTITNIQRPADVGQAKDK